MPFIHLPGFLFDTGRLPVSTDAKKRDFNNAGRSP